MIGPLALLVPLLSVLADDEPPDFEDLFQRAVSFNRPEILLNALDSTQRSNFKQWLSDRITHSENLDALAQNLLLKITFLRLMEMREVLKGVTQAEPSSGAYSTSFTSSPVTLPLMTFGGKKVISLVKAYDFKDNEAADAEELLKGLQEESIDVLHVHVLTWGPDVTVISPPGQTWETCARGYLDDKQGLWSGIRFPRHIFSWDEDRILLGMDLDSSMDPVLVMVDRPSGNRLSGWRALAIGNLQDLLVQVTKLTPRA
jgi:hypothetical protein